MKQALLISILFLSLPLLAQQSEEVVFKHLRVRGGFGGPIFELTGVNDQVGMLFGGGGGVVLNDFFIGGFGQGGSFAEYEVDNRFYPVNFGFGGIWLGYGAPSWKALHPFTNLKIGWGEVNIAENRQDWDKVLYDDPVFVVQPELGMELNLLRWFRLGLTVNYRVVSGVDPQQLAGLHNRDFNSLGAALTLRFGKFY